MFFSETRANNLFPRILYIYNNKNASKRNIANVKSAEIPD